MLRNERDRFHKLHPTEKCLMAWRFIPEYLSPTWRHPILTFQTLPHILRTWLERSELMAVDHRSRWSFVRVKFAEQVEASDR